MSSCLRVFGGRDITRVTSEAIDRGEIERLDPCSAVDVSTDKTTLNRSRTSAG